MKEIKIFKYFYQKAMLFFIFKYDVIFLFLKAMHAFYFKSHVILDNVVISFFIPYFYSMPHLQFINIS